MNPKQFGYPYDLRDNAPPTPVYIRDLKGKVLRIMIPSEQKRVRKALVISKERR